MGERASVIITTIDRIGSGGDGIADTRLHIARTLPGEAVRAHPGPGATRATLLDIVSASPERIDPPCEHFTQGCGGCALQHWSATAYTGWKRGLVTAALERAGYPNPPVGTLITTPPHARRRMDFAVQRRDGGVTLGLHRAHSTDIIDLHSCTVLHPTLLALIAPLRRTLTSLAALRRTGSVLANLVQNGADLLIRGDGDLAPTDRAKLAAFAAAHHIPRISWARGEATPETACLSATPQARFAGQAVDVPPGAFLQASAEGEAAIVAAVLAGVPDKLPPRARAIELYAGCGTLSFPLAARLRVIAYEGDAAASGAVRRAQAGHHLEITQRDLARQPLSPKELAGATIVVLDPPYAGAPLQMPALAAARTPRIIYISCNPGALSRDAATLRQAGYTLVSATPIDQFLWSPHVETVAVFTALPHRPNPHI
jgi:23S rRNA (uracil1939-C5)-methyltransferase